jgi:hypothetical protein
MDWARLRLGLSGPLLWAWFSRGLKGPYTSKSGSYRGDLNKQGGGGAVEVMFYCLILWSAESYGHIYICPQDQTTSHTAVSFVLG